MNYFLGLEVFQREKDIFVSQESYVKKTSCNPISTPMEPGTKLSTYGDQDKVYASKYQCLIRSLSYLTYTRPYLMLSVGKNELVYRGGEVYSLEDTKNNFKV